MSESSPCPLCGSDNVYSRLEDETVHCKDCGASANFMAWEYRPLEDALTAQREQARNSELTALEAYRKVEKERDALRAELEGERKAHASWKNGAGHWIIKCNEMEQEIISLRAKLEMAKEAMKAFIERFDDEDDTSMDWSVWVIEGIRDALHKLEDA